MNISASHTIRLASVEDIPEGEGREFRVGPRYVALFRYHGQFYALEDMCPHAGAPLNNGPIEKGAVTCLWHGWRFNLHDGVCINHPRGRDVLTFPIAVHGQDIYVTLPVDEGKAAG
jgi:nitrite reductase/ring-hydroxylating ferredoxin subunit